MVDHSTRKAYIALIIACLFWGMSFVWAKVVYQVWNPYTVVFLRMLISISVLVPLTKLVVPEAKISKKDIPRFLLVGLFEPLLYFTCEGNGLSLVSATVGSLIIATLPIFITLTARYYFMKS